MSVSKARPDVAFFRSLEQRLHRPEVRASPEAVDELLADDFVEFGSSGAVYNKALVIDALSHETQADALQPEVFDFAVTPISSGSVLVTYRSVRHAIRTTAGKQTLRSSVWNLVDGRWQMLFHQGTVIPPR